MYRGPGGAQGASKSVARLVVRAAPLRHAVPCIGYVVDEIDAGGRMDVAKATALGLPPGKVRPKDSVRTNRVGDPCTQT